MKDTVFSQGQAGRRQLLATLGSLTLFGILIGRFAGKGKARSQLPPKEKAIDPTPGAGKTARLLTQDGRLVEVDLNHGRPVGMVSNEELRDWIKPAKP